MEKLINRKLTIEEKKNIKCFLLAMPAVIFIIYFVILPSITSIRLSFTNWNGFSQNYNFVGWRNYLRVIEDRNFRRIMYNTFYLAIIYVPAQNILALLLAVLLTKISMRLSSFYKSIIFFPNLIAIAVIGFIWKLMFNHTFGLINTILRGLNLDFLIQDWLGQSNTVLPAIMVSILWYAVGYFMIIYAAGITAIPEQLYEAADIEGCGGLRKFIYITIPMLSTTITINVMLTTLLVFTSFDLIFTLTGGGPGYASETMPLAVYYYAYARNQMARALAMSVILGIIAIAIALVELKFMVGREEKVY